MRSDNAMRKRRMEKPPSKETVGDRSLRSTPVWWAWLDWNQRPHPYHQRSTAGRRAIQHLPRPRSSVDAERMG
jgi:hypothetical protein